MVCPLFAQRTLSVRAASALRSRGQRFLRKWPDLLRYLGQKSSFSPSRLTVFSSASEDTTNARADYKLEQSLNADLCLVPCFSSLKLALVLSSSTAPLPVEASLLA